MLAYFAFKVKNTVSTAQNKHEFSLSNLLFLIASFILLIIMIISIVLYRLKKNLRLYIRVIISALAIISSLISIEDAINHTPSQQNLDGSQIGAKYFFLGYATALFVWTTISYFDNWKVQCCWLTIAYIHSTIRVCWIQNNLLIMTHVALIIILNVGVVIRHKHRLTLVFGAQSNRNHNKDLKSILRFAIKTPLVILDASMKPRFCNQCMETQFNLPSYKNSEFGFMLNKLLESVKVEKELAQKLNLNHTELIAITDLEGPRGYNLYEFLQEADIKPIYTNEVKIANTLIEVNGEDLQFEIEINSVNWKDSLCYMIVFTDASTKTLNNKLTQINTYKDTLLATVSHDLRSPLNAVMGAIDGIEMDPTFPPNLKEDITLAKNSCGFLLLLINDILDFCQLQNKSLKLAFKKTNVRRLIQDVLSLVKLQANAKKIELLHEIPSSIPQWFSTDPNRLKQIIMNLLSNAIKFTSKGFVKLRLQMCVFQNTPFIEVSVQDTGIGIKSNDYPKLFTMYGKLDQQNSRINE